MSRTVHRLTASFYLNNWLTSVLCVRVAKQKPAAEGKGKGKGEDADAGAPAAVSSSMIYPDQSLVLILVFWDEQLKCEM